MTRRVVLFKGQTSWMQTPEFVGDKDEGFLTRHISVILGIWRVL